MSGALVIANRAAGAAEEERLQAALRRLSAERETELVRTEHVGQLDEVLDRLDERLLVVAGGDGSLHTALGRLHAHDGLATTTVGLVPLGTGNDFARGLGLPLDPEAAAELCLSGRETPMDLLLDNADGIVVNAVHAGLGANAAERSEGLKPRLGQAAYPVGALLAGLADQGSKLTVTVDDERVHAGELLMVAVMNGSCIGGGTALCSDARPDDGALDVLVVRAVDRTARVAFGTALQQGTHTDREDVLLVRGESVAIVGEGVRYDADGELSDPVDFRTYTVWPDAWKLLVPPDGRP